MTRIRIRIRILILYYSRHGATAELARYVAGGVERIADCEAVLRTLPAVSAVNEAVEAEIPKQGDVFATPDDLQSCDGLIVGSPTRFGTAAAALKHFFDQTASLWLSGALDGKPGAVFTSTASMHGGQESTLLSMMLPLMHHGMVMVGIPFHATSLGKTQSGGAPYGAGRVVGDDHKRALSSDEKKLAEVLGERVARCAKVMGMAMAGQ